MADKSKPAEGVALSVQKPHDRYKAGVPVAGAHKEDVSATEAKSGQQATPTKEKS